VRPIWLRSAHVEIPQSLARPADSRFVVAASRPRLAVLADLALAIACAALVVGLLLLRGGVWQYQTSGDFHALHVSRYTYAARILVEEHRLPLWDPYDYFGAPFLAQPQAAVLYPPVALLYGFLSPWAAFQAFHGLHIFILALGMLLYLRRHGIGRVPALVGILSAVAVTFRGSFLIGVDHPCYLAAVAYVPWLLLFTEQVVEGPGVRRAIGWLAATMAMLWLTGYPDFGLDLFVLLMLTALLTAGRRFVSSGPLVGFALLLGTAVVAGVLVPAAEQLSWSVRGENIAAGSQSSFAFFRWAAFRMQISSIPRAIFDRFGIAITLLALSAMLTLRRTPVAWIACTVWTIFAVNRPLSLLYHLPIYSGIRFPFGWSYLTGLFVSLLVARALASGLESNRPWRRHVALGLGVFATVHALAIIIRAPTSLPEFQPGNRLFQAPDYALIDQRAPVLRDLLRAHPEARLVSELDQAAGAYLTRHLRSPSGFDPSAPDKLTYDLVDAAGLYDALGVQTGTNWRRLAERPDLAARLGVGFVVLPRGREQALVGAGFQYVMALPGNGIVVFRPPIPRARLVHQVIYAAPDETLQTTIDRSPDGASLAVLEAGDRVTVEPQRTPDDEAVWITDETPESVSLEARVAAPALLVLTDTFFPGWTATVDGVPVTIHRTDHAFRGIELSPGSRRVVFRYRPRSVVVGLSISAGALLVVLGLILMPLRRASHPR
jgi:Bacterial membrane protein YfhO